MAAPHVSIVAAGVCTPVGLSLPEAAASARGRVARLREIAWMDRRFEPFVVGSVPEAGLPPLAEPLTNLPLQYREDRMLRLAQVALEDLFSFDGGMTGLAIDADHPLPLLLALPEHHTTLPIDPEAFLRRLATQSGLPLDLPRSLAVPRGRAAGLMALRQAATWLHEGELPFLLVGGVDTLVDLYVLGTLDMEGRVRNEVNSDGFSPGEGAGFVLLCTQDTAAEHGLEPLAVITGTAIGQEAGHLYSDEPYLGEGLAAVFAELLLNALPPEPIGCVYASFNGERLWAREYGVARVRCAAAFEPDNAVEHPAEVFGDLGAAHGVVMLALAAHGVFHGYRRAPCLVFASSDHADRAATLLTQAAA